MNCVEAFDTSCFAALQASEVIFAFGAFVAAVWALRVALKIRDREDREETRNWARDRLGELLTTRVHVHMPAGFKLRHPGEVALMADRYLTVADHMRDVQADLFVLGRGLRLGPSGPEADAARQHLEARRRSAHAIELDCRVLAERARNRVAAQQSLIAEGSDPANASGRHNFIPIGEGEKHYRRPDSAIWVDEPGADDVPFYHQKVVAGLEDWFSEENLDKDWQALESLGA